MGASLSALAVATLVWEAGERKPTRLLVATLVWEPRAGGKGGDPPSFSWRPGTNKERDSLTDTTPSVEPGLTGAMSPYRTSWKTPRRRKTASTHRMPPKSTCAPGASLSQVDGCWWRSMTSHTYETLCCAIAEKKKTSWRENFIRPLSGVQRERFKRKKIYIYIFLRTLSPVRAILRYGVNAVLASFYTVSWFQLSALFLCRHHNYIVWETNCAYKKSLLFK